MTVVRHASQGKPHSVTIEGFTAFSCDKIVRKGQKIPERIEVSEPS